MFTGLERSGMTEETEVVAKARRRRFTAAEKLRVLREADRCTRPGELGALLRRERLYSSHLSAWRAARKRGEMAGLTSRRRGPKPQRPDPRERRIVELERENRRCRRGRSVPRDWWSSKKSGGDLGDAAPRERREALMRLVDEQRGRFGVAKAPGDDRVAQSPSPSSPWLR